MTPVTLLTGLREPGAFYHSYTNYLGIFLLVDEFSIFDNSLELEFGKRKK